MLLFIFDIGKPWLDATGTAKEILFVDSILIGLKSHRTVSQGCLVNQWMRRPHLQSGRGPALRPTFGPSERVAGGISGAGLSLALRHSIERDQLTRSTRNPQKRGSHERVKLVWSRGLEKSAERCGR